MKAGCQCEWDDIYIHPKDMSLDLTVLHDSGEETCFADVDTLFDHSTEDSRIAGRATVNPFINTDNKYTDNSNRG